MRKLGRFVFLGLAASVVTLLGVTSPARGGGMTTGFAVAVTADGSRLVAGGSNRVLYELDPATLEVKRRVWLGRQIMSMLFSPDGKVLVVESTQAVQWLKADTLEPFHTVKDASRIRSVPALDAVAMYVPSYKEPAIRVYGFADGEEKAAAVFDPKQRFAAYGVSADGKKVAMLHARTKDEKEEKITGRDIPEELRTARGAALADFEQRHDGFGQLFHVFDLTSGEQIFEKYLWFSCQGYADLLAWHGDEVYAIGYRNHCARIDAQGEITVYVLPNASSAIHASPDGKTVWTGDGLLGSRTQMPERSAETFQIDKMSGFTEGLKSFAQAANGTAFAGTNAFRVIRISADGKVEKVAPVY